MYFENREANASMLEMENTNPPWLKQLLKANFYADCRAHENYKNNQCNRYCIECTGDPFCRYCLDAHENHQTIQIRRSSRSNAVRVDDIKNHINLGAIQTYITNGQQSVFLNKRPHKELPLGVMNICNICCHSLLAGNFKFCCLSCKREAISRGSAKQTFSIETELHAREIDHSVQINQSSTPNTKSKVRRLHKLLDKGSIASTSATKRATRSIYPATTPMFNHLNSRKRKGIPRRAPLT
ncbi:hypothetical protein RHSIM_Rhsim06G0202200 [Rhododendron simsii]|uniref:PLATZ transcription factor family protein n=1 Tax=Rhododendron simsii TaxID=118357 RepID=A0A834GUX1_RHOSS|nr:hypothetical protein RHSIM_Rhsim06G0202200 [Rhododendron simsii]